MTRAPTTVGVRDVESLLQRHADVAGRALVTLLRGGPLCAAAGAGPDAKRHEGAISALAQLRREMRRHDRAGAPGDVQALVRTIAVDWRKRAEAPAMYSPDWQAYLAGGVQALEALAAQLNRGAQSGDST